MLSIKSVYLSTTLASVTFVATIQLVGQVKNSSDETRTARSPVHVVPQLSTGPTGIFPAQMRKAYGLASVPNQGAGQTIAIVVAFDDPAIESDLAVFSSQFGLPPCTTGNGCFEKVYASGSQPAIDANWVREISLDVEWAHAMAPQAKILLVEGATASITDLLTAVDVAVQRGARVVSMSFGADESNIDVPLNSHFNIPGITFVAASGDSGAGVWFPAASPFVVGVGGTVLSTASDGTYINEIAWSGSGGGTSVFESEPVFQMPFQQSGKRTIPDVSYNGGAGVAVYDSIRYKGQSGWIQLAGTSAGTPQWAAMFAIVNSSRSALGKPSLGQVLPAVYTLVTDLHDIASGTQKGCPHRCGAIPGYDTITGLGTPIADLLVPALVGDSPHYGDIYYFPDDGRPTVPSTGFAASDFGEPCGYACNYTGKTNSQIKQITIWLADAVNTIPAAITVAHVGIATSIPWYLDAPDNVVCHFDVPWSSLHVGKNDIAVPSDVNCTMPDNRTYSVSIGPSDYPSYFLNPATFYENGNWHSFAVLSSGVF